MRKKLIGVLAAAMLLLTACGDAPISAGGQPGSQPAASGSSTPGQSGSSSESEAPTSAPVASLPPSSMAENGSTAGTQQTEEDKPMVEITMKDGGVIKLELDREAAPETVDNFVKLVEEKFYDGLIFHRVIEGFMIQGGCPDGTGMGGPGYEIKGEFAANGWDNPIKHTPGVISMARSSDPDSAGSQFFIMHGTATHLDGNYAAFGKVVEGMDVVNRIAEGATGAADRPLEDVVIDTIRIVE